MGKDKNMPREAAKAPDMSALSTERVFYTLDGCDVLSVLVEPGTGRRFLSSCCKLNEEWVVTEASPAGLAKLVSNEIPIRAMFEDGPSWRVTWDGERESVSESPDSGLFPKPGAMLDLSGPSLDAYRERLLSEARNT